MLTLGTHVDDGWFRLALAADLLVGRGAPRFGHHGIWYWWHYGRAVRDRRVFDLQTPES